MNKNENLYAKAIAFGNYYILDKMIPLEKRASIKEKKLNVYKEKLDLLLQTYPGEQEAITSDKRELKVQLLSSVLNKNEKTLFIIDLAFSNPFAPHDLKYKIKDFHRGLHYIGSLVHLTKKDVDDVLKVQKRVFKSQRQIKYWTVGLYGLGGLILFGVGGWLVAPAIGAYLGTAAGYVGIAATLHGLALLGGGTLASGGFGVAGGMWLITGLGGASGIIAAGGGNILFKLGAALLRIPGQTCH